MYIKIAIATKNVTQIMTTNTHNTLHKRHQHNLNQTKNILQINNLTITKADKSKKPSSQLTKNTLKQKIDTFIQENHITRLNKDPTDFYQKCDIMIDKRAHKYLINIKPTSIKD